MYIIICKIMRRIKQKRSQNYFHFVSEAEMSLKYKFVTPLTSMVVTNQTRER